MRDQAHRRNPAHQGRRRLYGLAADTLSIIGAVVVGAGLAWIAVTAWMGL